MAKSNLVALVVIARNEAPRIARLLDSVRPWVDSMLVLDTGSDDDTVQIARRCGARVEHARWSDDFAQARNLALDRAAADWHLVLDADEWLVEGGPFLRHLVNQLPSWAGQVRLDEIAAAGSDSDCTARNWITRLLPGMLRYQGRIHEQPVHDLPLKRTPMVVGHDGYGPQALVAKRGRNRLLLLKALEEEPEDPYLLYQCGKDADVYDEHNRAHEYFARAWQRATHASPWRHDLVVRWLSTMKHLGLHQCAADLAQAESQRYANSPDFHFAVGDLMLDWTAAAPQRTLELLGKAEHAWRRCLAIGERPEWPGSVPGRGSHLAAFNLALLLDVTGRGNAALALRRSFGLAETPLTA